LHSTHLRYHNNQPVFGNILGGGKVKCSYNTEHLCLYIENPVVVNVGKPPTAKSLHVGAEDHLGHTQHVNRPKLPRSFPRDLYSRGVGIDLPRLWSGLGNSKSRHGSRLRTQLVGYIS